MTRLVAAWDRFWFAPAPTSTLAVLRIAYGVLSLAWGLALVPDVRAFFSSSGLVARQPGWPGWGLFAWFPSDGAVFTVFVVLLLSSVCVIVGFRTRLATLLVFVSVLSFQSRNPFILHSGDLVLRNLGFFLLLAPAGASLSVDRWRRHRHDFWQFPARAIWPLRLVQIQLSVIYIRSVWAKMQGVSWNDGTAVSYALRVPDIQRLPVPSFVTDWLPLVNVLTFGTLAVETALGILVWNRRARPWVLALGVGLHLSIDWALMVGLFGLTMITLYLAWLPPDKVSAYLLRLRNGMASSRFAVLRRPAG